MRVKPESGWENSDEIKRLAVTFKIEANHTSRTHFKISEALAVTFKNV